MKFAVIGCGSIGRRHIRTLLSLGHQVIAYNRGNARRAAAAREFGIRVFDKTEAAFEAGIDAAIICSPNSLHVEHALQGVRAGVHLFIEKPLSHSWEGVETLREEVRRRRLVTHVGSNMRFHFGPAFVKQELEKGSLGRLLWAFIWGGMYLPDWHPDEDYRQMYSAKKHLGGGAVLDFIHELDLALWFFGAPECLAAMTSRSGWLDIETEDIADAVLSYSNSFQANIHIDYLQKPPQRGIRIIGTKGWIEWNRTKELVEVYCMDGGKADSYPYPEGYDKQEMYNQQMQYFIDCLQHKKRSMSDLDAGIQALNLALKIKESSSSRNFTVWQSLID